MRDPGEPPRPPLPTDPSGQDPSGQDPPRRLHPLPPGLVELYGLLAVLFVLVPEWMAGGALVGFREGRRGSSLPPPSIAWQRMPELRLATMGMARLRQLARRQGICGYAGLSRERLTARLLKRLKGPAGRAKPL
jgi:hypothetical protein